MIRLNKPSLLPFRITVLTVAATAPLVSDSSASLLGTGQPIIFSPEKLSFANDYNTVAFANPSASTTELQRQWDTRPPTDSSI